MTDQIAHGFCRSLEWLLVAMVLGCLATNLGVAARAETSRELAPDVDLDIEFHLGMAYQNNQQFAKARKFYEEYKLADYPNITMGRDPSYMLGTFYKVRSFPSIFVYDKKGNFVTSFVGSTPIEQIAASLK